jgi:hypothetical protein
MARHELARFQESDNEVVYQERKRYSRVLSQQEYVEYGIASKYENVKKKPKSSSSTSIFIFQESNQQPPLNLNTKCSVDSFCIL